jgi:SAM-dependent methyltransferase
MKKVKDIYQQAYDQHGNSLESLFIPKGRQKERFDSLSTFCSEGSSILDFGCGFGHLYGYLKNKLNAFTYEGCDIVDNFVNENKQNINDDFFYKIDDYLDVAKNYDFIIAAGVFNLLYSENRKEHKKIVTETITHLFHKTNKVLSINFMSDQVDFEAPDAYHQNIFEIYNFSFNNLSRRINIDQSYMPYEYTIHIFNDSEIIKPDNVFRPIK